MVTTPHPYTAQPVAVNLLTHGSHQFAVWYDLAGELHIGRILRGTQRFGVDHDEYTFAGTPRTALDLPVHDDDHNYPCVFVDGRGFLHVMANMHNDPLRYVRTTAAHTTDGWLADAGWVNASSELPGVEAHFTYPTPVPLPDGRVFLYARNDDGNSLSGRADGQTWMLSTSGTWSARRLFMQGIGVPNAGGPGIPGTSTATDDVTNWSPYPTNFLIESSRGPNPGRMHVSWVWRHTGAGGGVSGFENILPHYAYSDDQGTTWYAVDGTELTVPMHPLNAHAARVNTGGALVTSIVRSGGIVIADLDTTDHGLTNGSTITVVVQNSSFEGNFTIGSVGNPAPTSVAWGQAGADESGGVGSVTRIRYINWGGIDVDHLGLPHIVGSISPMRYIRRNATNTGWTETTVANPQDGIVITSRAHAFWVRNHVRIMVETRPDYMRRIRLFDITGDRAPVTMSGVVGSGLYDPSPDPEAWRRFGVIELLAPFGKIPRVFTYGGPRARVRT